MADFDLKQNDTAPAILATLKDSTGAAVDLTGGSVVFKMASSAGVLIVNAAATIVDAATGQVSYSWDAADTATAGLFKAEFELTDAGGDVQTFPGDGWISVRITPDLDS